MNPPHVNAETEALIQGYLESTLTPEESTRLLSSLKAQPELVGVLLDGLRMDALIREVVSQTGPVSDTTSTRFRPASAPLQVSPTRTISAGPLDEESPNVILFPQRVSAPRFWQTGALWKRPALLALAASVVLLLSLSVWYFGPTMGRPVFAELKGVDASIERGTEFVPAVNGMALRPNDVLRVGTNASATIAFGTEKTRLELTGGTELKLASLTRGKRFALLAGVVEASVARQRPFHPMILTTPQAEARVVGTRFTLTASPTATRLDVTEGTVRFTRISDEKFVRVGAGDYAVATMNSELAALPKTGGLLREWWSDLTGKTMFALHEDPRFPNHPDTRDTTPNFELQVAQTNRLGVRLRGYLHPPVTGDYQFWMIYSLREPNYAEVTMSRNERPADRVIITRTGIHGRGASQAPPPIPMVAGRRYYVEAQILITSESDGRLSMEWKPPGGTREPLTGKFLSPFKPK